MGNNYLLHQDASTEVYIYESSNKLTLEMVIPGDEFASLETKPLSPVEMLRLLLKGIRATSYWMSEKEFKQIFSELEVYPFDTLIK